MNARAGPRLTVISLRALPARRPLLGQACRYLDAES